MGFAPLFQWATEHLVKAKEWLGRRSPAKLLANLARAFAFDRSPDRSIPEFPETKLDRAKQSAKFLAAAAIVRAMQRL